MSPPLDQIERITFNTHVETIQACYFVSAKPTVVNNTWKTSFVEFYEKHFSSSSPFFLEQH